jgi:hypothetical protein
VASSALSVDSVVMTFALWILKNVDFSKDEICAKLRTLFSLSWSKWELLMTFSWRGFWVWLRQMIHTLMSLPRYCISLSLFVLYQAFFCLLFRRMVRGALLDEMGDGSSIPCAGILCVCVCVCVCVYLPVLILKSVYCPWPVHMPIFYVLQGCW